MVGRGGGAHHSRRIPGTARRDKSLEFKFYSIQFLLLLLLLLLLPPPSSSSSKKERKRRLPFNRINAKQRVYFLKEQQAGLDGRIPASSIQQSSNPAILQSSSTLDPWPMTRNHKHEKLSYGPSEWTTPRPQSINQIDSINLIPSLT